MEDQPRDGPGAPPAPSPAPEEGPFTWEVYRNFYPEPRWPREPTPQESRAIVGSLLISGLLLLAAAGLYAWVGTAGSVGNYETEVHGLVTGNGMALQGAVVVLTENGTHLRIVATNPSGYFTFTEVQEGTIDLEFVAPSFTTTTITLLIAPFLGGLESNVTDLSVQLTPQVPGNTSEVRSMDFAPFPDLETYLTNVYSVTLVEAIGGLVALWGGLALRRARRPPRGVVGGTAAFLAPLFPLVLSGTLLYSIFYPPSLILLCVACVLGLTSVGLIVRTYHPFLMDDL